MDSAPCPSVCGGGPDELAAGREQNKTLRAQTPGGPQQELTPAKVRPNIAMAPASIGRANDVAGFAPKPCATQPAGRPCESQQRKTKRDDNGVEVRRPPRSAPTDGFPITGYRVPKKP